MQKVFTTLPFLLLSCFSLAASSQVSMYPFTSDLTESAYDLFPLPVEDAPEKEELIIFAGGKSLKEQVIERSRTLEDRLSQKIFGQEEAVRETANAIIRFAAGINDPNMPIASLLYCGPSGVGKTELAKQLCLELYGKESHFVRINMSEYSEFHTISRLIGAPPGYIGYESGGALSNPLLENPFSVVLLDEIEKAHPKVLKLFLHVFDAGYFTSALGEDVNCRNAIFILTSNIAASEIADLHQSGYNHQEILEFIKPELISILSPEMFNRLDCMVFSPLSEDVFTVLINKILNELAVRILKAKGIEIIFDKSVVEHLKSYSLDPRLGARPLKRAVEKELTTVLAKAIIDNACKPGDVVLCSHVSGHIHFEIVFSSEEKK